MNYILLTMMMTLIVHMHLLNLKYLKNSKVQLKRCLKENLLAFQRDSIKN